jgi:transcriptional regulator with XRE-family HTH domain
MNIEFKERLRGILLELLDQKKKESGGKISQRVFAELVGMNQSVLSDYLNCKRVPTMGPLELIALARSQNPEELLADLYGRSLGSSTSPIEEQIRSLDAAAKFNLMKVLVMELSGGTPEQLDAGRKITPQMIDLLDLEETIDIMELLIERQRVLLKTFSPKKVSR